MSLILRLGKLADRCDYVYLDTSVVHAHAFGLANKLRKVDTSDQLDPQYLRNHVNFSCELACQILIHQNIRITDRILDELGRDISDFDEDFSQYGNPILNDCVELYAFVYRELSRRAIRYSPQELEEIERIEHYLTENEMHQPVTGWRTRRGKNGSKGRKTKPLSKSDVNLAAYAIYESYRGISIQQEPHIAVVSNDKDVRHLVKNWVESSDQPTKLSVYAPIPVNGRPIKNRWVNRLGIYRTYRSPILKPR